MHLLLSAVVQLSVETNRLRLALCVEDVATSVREILTSMFCLDSFGLDESPASSLALR